MAKVVVKAKVKKLKRKFPVEIKAPEYMNSISLGKTDVTDLNLLVGRTTKLNMMYVSGNVKNQNIRLVFKIVEVSSGLAKTEVCGYYQIPYYLSRFVKAGSDLVEDSFVTESSDGKKVRVQPFIVTKSNASSMIGVAIRALVREVIAKDIASRSYSEFISQVISGKVQIAYRNEVKKIFPLKAFEFREVELVE